MGVLDGKVALVTGSSQGIGKALATGFAAEGAYVWVHGLEKAAGEALANEISGRYIYADFTDSQQIDALVDEFAASTQSLDILVNNAGIEVIMPIGQIDMATLDRIWQVNVRAPVHLSQRLLPFLKRAGRASIINMTSIHDEVPYPNNSAYSLSKAALAMFTKTAAVELAPKGIRVNNLAPGAVETDINREVIKEIGEKKFREWIPIGRVAQTQEMIGPALFLASDASSYVTGTTLYVDGAYSKNLVRYRPSQE